MTTWWRMTIFVVAIPIAACSGSRSGGEAAEGEPFSVEVSPAAAETSAEAAGPLLPTTTMIPGHEGQREIYAKLLAETQSYLAGASGRAELSSFATEEVLDHIDTLASGAQDRSGLVLHADVQSSSEDAAGVRLIDCLSIETGDARNRSTRFEQQRVRLEPAGADNSWIVTSIEVLTPTDGPPDCVPTELASLTTAKVDRYLQAANGARNNPRFVFDGSELDSATTGSARSAWLSILHQLVATKTNYEIDEESQVEIVGFAPSPGEAVLIVRACRRWVGEAAVISNGERRNMIELAESGLVASEMVEDLLVWATGSERGKVFELLGEQPVTSCWTTKEGS